LRMANSLRLVNLADGAAVLYVRTSTAQRSCAALSIGTVSLGAWASTMHVHKVHSNSSMLCLTVMVSNSLSSRKLILIYASGRSSDSSHSLRLPVMDKPTVALCKKLVKDLQHRVVSAIFTPFPFNSNQRD